MKVSTAAMLGIIDVFIIALIAGILFEILPNAGKVEESSIEYWIPEDYLEIPEKMRAPVLPESNDKLETAQAFPHSVLIAPTRDNVQIDQAEYAYVDETELACLREALYWEGRNQVHAGMAAIGHVILNRADSNSFPDSVCGVVHQGPMDGSTIRKHRCQFSYYCDGKSDEPRLDNIIEERAWNRADEIAYDLLTNQIQDNTHGSTYYHAHYVDPAWNDVFVLNTRIDDHLFYSHN